MTYKITKTQGYRADAPDERDHVFGSGATPAPIILPSGNWNDLFIKDEMQYRGFWDTYGCVTFSFLNATEKLAKLLFGEEWNKSERYTYIASDTTPNVGNSPRVVADSIRHKGVIDEQDLPFDASIDSIEKFNSPKPLTQELLDKGKLFLQDYEFRYDFLPASKGEVSREMLRAALYRSPVCIGVFAWAEKDGKYYRLGADTHLTLLTNVKDNGELEIFDSYSPSHKTLSADFPIYTAIRVFLRKKTEAEKEAEQKKLNFIIAAYQWIVNALQYIIDYKRAEEAELVKLSPTTLPKDENTLIPEIIPKTPISPSLPPKTTLVVPFAEAIKRMEGWFVGSRSYKNLNPGNLKMTSYTKSLGAIGKDKDNFAIFPDYAKGFSALCQFIQDAADDKLKLCKQCTIYSFIEKYAPASDNNKPRRYAEYIASQIKVKPTVLLKDII